MVLAQQFFDGALRYRLPSLTSADAVSTCTMVIIQNFALVFGPLVPVQSSRHRAWVLMATNELCIAAAVSSPQVDDELPKVWKQLLALKIRLNVGDVKQTCQCEATPWNWARCRNSPCAFFSCCSGALCQIIFIKDRASWCSHMQALQLIHLKDIEVLFRLILTGSNLSFLFLQAFHQIVAFFVGTFQIWRFCLVWVQLWLLWLTHFNLIFFPGVFVIHLDKKKLLGPNPLGQTKWSPQTPLETLLWKRSHANPKFSK